MQINDPKRYYATQGILTDPGPYSGLYETLPCDPAALCAILNGVMLHPFWKNLVDLQISPERQREEHIRSMYEKMPRLLALDDRPLTVARSFEERFLGNCRDLSLMLCSMLRYHHIPARVRAGFATYFDPRGHLRMDHWVCEYWSAQEQRWVMVDPQLQQVCLEQHRLPPEAGAAMANFRPMDMLPGQFLTAGEAWKRCRAGDDPNRYGIEGDLWGLWFVRGTMLRDLLCLNKIEPLPWDCWGIVTNDRTGPAQEELEWLDHVASVTIAADAAFDEIRTLYEHTPGLHLPPECALAAGA